MRRTVLGIALACALVQAPVVAAAGDMRAAPHPQITLVQKPAVGDEAKAEIGSPIIVSARAAIVSVVDLDEAASGSSMGQKLTAAPGQYRLVGVDDDGGFYAAPGLVTSRYWGMTDPMPSAGIYVPHDDAGEHAIYWRAPIGIMYRAKVDAMKFRRGNLTDLREGGFHRELIYGGVSRGTITLTYREYANDMARPAFTQELKYDLADGEEIGFRGARIRVIKASNTEITYVVLSPLN